MTTTFLFFSNDVVYHNSFEQFPWFDVKVENECALQPLNPNLCRHCVWQSFVTQYLGEMKEIGYGLAYYRAGVLKDQGGRLPLSV